MKSKRIISYKMLAVIVTCLVLLVAAATTFAIFAFRNEAEKELYTETILLDTAFRDYYLIDINNIEMGSQVSGRILLNRDETSSECYVRVFAALEFGDYLYFRNGKIISEEEYLEDIANSTQVKFSPTGNQQKWLDIANATLIETTQVASGAGYRWSQSYGGYYYLLNETESNEIMLKLDDSSVVYELTSGVKIPTTIDIPTETMPLKLKIKAEAIQSEYIYEYLKITGEDEGSTENEIIRDSIAPIMNSAFGVNPVEKMIISYETNGGTPISPYIFNYMQNITLPDVKTEKKGYVFDCWCKDKDLTIVAEYSTSTEFEIDTNRTYYARWKKGVVVNFMFADNEGSNGVDFDDYPDTFEEGAIVLPEITFGEYTLVYFENRDCSGKYFLPNVTLTKLNYNVLYGAWFHIGESCYSKDANGIVDSYSGTYHSLLLPDSIKGFSGSVVSGIFTTGGQNSILKRIVLNSNITTIPNYVFKDCVALETIKCYSEIKTIGEYSFQGCVSLDHLEFNSVESIGEGAFDGCVLLDLVLGESCTSIHATALDGESVTIKSTNCNIIGYTEGVSPFPTGSNYRVYVKQEAFWNYYKKEGFSSGKEALRSIETFNISVLLNDEEHSAYIGVRKGQTIVLANYYQNSYYTIAGGGGTELEREVVLGDESKEDFLDLKYGETNYIYGYSGEYFKVTFAYAENETNISPTGSGEYSEGVLDDLVVKSYKGSVLLPEIYYPNKEDAIYQLVWFDDYSATSGCYYENNIATILEDTTFYGVWFHIGTSSDFERFSSTGDSNIDSIRYKGSFKNVIFSDDYSSKGDKLASKQKQGLIRVILQENIAEIYDSAFYINNSTPYSIKFVYTCGEITSVGVNAFKKCSNLVSINLFGVKTIKDSAFESCENLLRVNVNEKEFTGTIGNNAFNGCISLQQMSMSYVSGIGKSAFKDCIALTSPVDIGGHALGLVRIEDYAFHNCKSIAYIKIGAGVDYIGGGAFYNCISVRTVTLESKLIDNTGYTPPLKVKDIVTPTSNNYPFGNCGDKLGFELVIKSNRIPAYMFYTNYGNDYYSSADYTTENSIFNGPKISSIKFNVDAVEIGEFAFAGLQSCPKFEFTGVNMVLKASAFECAYGLLSVNIDADYLEVNDRAFYGCRKLCIINFEHNPVVQGVDALTAIYDKYQLTGAITKSTKWSSYHIETEFPLYSIESSYDGTYWMLLFDKTRTLDQKAEEDENIDLLRENEDAILMAVNYFAEEVSISKTFNYVYGAGVGDSKNFMLDFVAPYASAYGKHLKGIMLPCEVRERAFYYCVQLEDLKFSDCVLGEKIIGVSAFENCGVLSSVLFDPVDQYASTFLTISSRAFYGCEKLTEFKFPESLLYIESSAFENCKSFTKLDFNLNLKTIEYRAFANCSSLRKVNMKNNVIRIGEGAFTNCTRLIILKFSEILETIGKKAFYNCTSLGRIETFEGETSVDYIELPASMTKTGLGEEAFRRCLQLKKIKIFKSNETFTYNNAFIDFALDEIHVYAYVLGDYIDEWDKQNFRNYILIDKDGYSRPWDGDKITFKGEGTEDDPYLIASGKHMKYLNDIINNAIKSNAGLETYLKFYFQDGIRNDEDGETDPFLDKFFKVVCNVDFNGEPYTPICPTYDQYYRGYVFAGDFNGNGFTFKNINLHDYTTDNSSRDDGLDYFLGVFGVIGAYGDLATRIRNLSVIYENDYTTATNFGGVVGYVSNVIAGWGWYHDNPIKEDGNIIIENCHTSGRVICSRANPYSSSLYYGGILGMTPMRRSVTRCISGLDIESKSGVRFTGTYVYLGGVVGWTSGDITHCGNSGSINFTTNSPRVLAGGIISEQQGDIGACFNTGTITITSRYSGARVFAGGISGLMSDAYLIIYTKDGVRRTSTNFTINMNINNCYNVGNIRAVANYGSSYAIAGGIVGYLYKNPDGETFYGTTNFVVKSVYNLGSITASCNSYCAAGGVLGEGYMTIKNVVADGPVNTSGSSNLYIGGLIGRARTFQQKSYLTDCRIRFNVNNGKWTGGSGSDLTTGGFSGVRMYGASAKKSITVGSNTYTDLYADHNKQIDISYFYNANFDIMKNFNKNVWNFSPYTMPAMKWVELATSVSFSDAFDTDIAF